jgi:hypothetical protein
METASSFVFSKGPPDAAATRFHEIVFEVI